MLGNIIAYSILEFVHSLYYITTEDLYLRAGITLSKYIIHNTCDLHSPRSSIIIDTVLWNFEEAIKMYDKAIIMKVLDSRQVK